MNKLGRIPVIAALLAMMFLAACGGKSSLSSVPTGEAAYAIVPPPDANAPRRSYIIVPNDVLSLQVFQEPDLSNKELQVDNVGNIQMPLIGEVRASGLSALELADEVAARLRERYIVNPQVVVSVDTPAKRYVAVEGQVKRPGVFEIDRDYTLLSAIARAESPTKEAKLDEVVVFRTVDGQRMAARFDLDQIRGGKAPDPPILGGDVVVIGYSSTKGLLRDVLQAAPVFNIFAVLASQNNN